MPRASAALGSDAQAQHASSGAWVVQDDVDVHETQSFCDWSSTIGGLSHAEELPVPASYGIVLWLELQAAPAAPRHTRRVVHRVFITVAP